MNFLKYPFNMLIAFSFIFFISTTVFSHPHCRPDFKCERPCCIPMPSCPPRKLLMDGFYAAGQIGYDSFWVRENISTPEFMDINGNPKINAPGWVGGAFLGYGRYLYEPFYLGAEIVGNYSQANESYSLMDSIGFYSAKISARWSYGVALLPGFGVTDSLLAYIRIGYNWGYFLANETAVTISTSKKNTVSGINYGLGMEALIVDNFSVRAEYTHTNYNSFSTAFGTNFDPSNNQVMVAIIYHFWGATC